MYQKEKGGHKVMNNKRRYTYEQLNYYFNGYLNNQINDEEMTKVLKDICKNGLSEEEVYELTDMFIKSGDVLEVNPNFIDKHSTGGVGDKTTLIVLPILASLGIKVSKMSGRALGYTGGTIDKLNSIGVKTDFTKEEFYNLINEHNMVISSQTENLCPMDKKVYALRDVTNTTNSVPLIATSIMSKKIASGASKILLDVKVGRGALVSNIEEAKELANLMIKIGEKYNRQVVCMLTRMDNPLGNNVGNKIEVMEVIDILKNGKRNELSTLCIEMASIMYSMNQNTLYEEAKEKVLTTLDNKEAYTYFEKYIQKTGGNLNIELPNPEYILSKKEGYVNDINSLKIGTISMRLGAGRISKEDEIDPNAGVILGVKIDDYVKEGDILAKLYGNKKVEEKEIYDAFKISIIDKKENDIIIEVLGNY